MFNLGLFTLIVLCLPPILVGIAVVKKYSEVKRIELLLPSGIIIGLSLYIFLLNITFHIIPGELGILLSYLGLLILCIVFYKNTHLKLSFKFDLKFLLLWAFSIIFWGGFLYWKAGHALIGGDVNIYYSIASSFIKGNYPPMAPWQPDVSLSYHIGVLELLGALHFLTNLSYEFLHLALSFIFVFSAIQIVLWFVGIGVSIKRFILINTLIFIVFISSGFLKIAFPTQHHYFPNIASFNDLIIWLRQLPTARESIEVYGAPTNLDALIYVIFHAAGISLFLSIVTLLTYPLRRALFKTWVIVLISASSLALTNEAIFVAAFPAFLVCMYLWYFYNFNDLTSRPSSLISDLRFMFIVIKKSITLKTLSSFILGSYGKLTLLIFLMGTFVFLQGGVITNNLKLFNNGKIESSVVVFPKRDDIKGDFISYHLDSMRTKIHPPENQWLPFKWISLGVDLMLLFGFIFVFLNKATAERKQLYLLIFLTSLFAILSYNFIVPKYILANSNRILVIAFQLLAILFLLFSFWFMNLLFGRKKTILTVLKVIFFVLVILPTVIPPIATLSKTRFGENKLIPKYQQKSHAHIWIKNNLSLKERVVVLDSRTPHPSGAAKLMINSGVSSPVFAGGFKSYSIEAGPEYMDIAYTLSPKALNDLSIDYLLLDNVYIEKLPQSRREQLNNDSLFEILHHSNKEDGGWERVYKVKGEYFRLSQELDGTLSQFKKIAPLQGSYYIDDDKKFNPDFLRRAIIFTLKDRDLSFVAGSGVYQHTEIIVNFKDHQAGNKYKYYVLADGTSPFVLCQCQTKALWQSYNKMFFLWENLDI